jgi:hypothetical protein
MLVAQRLCETDLGELSAHIPLDELRDKISLWKR